MKVLIALVLVLLGYARAEDTAEVDDGEVGTDCSLVVPERWHFLNADPQSTDERSGILLAEVHGTGFT